MTKDKVTLTREWIMLMLYDSKKSRHDLIEKGCKVMVFGHEYDDFVNIIDSLISEKYIDVSLDRTNYFLTEKGIFYVKKHILVPFLTLTEDNIHFTQFLEKYRDYCDVSFLRSLNDPDQSKMIFRIKNYAEQNYEKIAKILILIAEYFGKTAT